jgi:Na+-driven multidrug efflux pump
VALPGLWIALFSTAPEIHALGAQYLVLVSLAYPFLGLGLALAAAFQAAGRPLWPLLAVSTRALVVIVGGWLVIHLTDAGLHGLAVVAAAGLVAYGVSLAITFRAGVWQQASS